MEDGILFEFAAVGDGDVALDAAEDDDGAGLHIADDLGILTDGEVAFGIHFAFDATVDDEVVREAELALDLDIAGKDVFATGHPGERSRDAWLGSGGGFLGGLAGVRAVVLIDDLFEHGWKVFASYRRSQANS